MTIEEILPWLTILGFLFGVGKWVANAASNLTKAITALNVVVQNLADSFSAFKTDAQKEHEKTRDKLEDHETRIHTLEDWKKFHDGEETQHD